MQVDHPILPTDLAYHFEVIVFFSLVNKKTQDNKIQLVFPYNCHFDVIHTLEQKEFKIPLFSLPSTL
jgi:hypothetical protein